MNRDDVTANGEAEPDSVAVRAAAIMPQHYTSDVRSMLLVIGLVLVVFVATVLLTGDGDWSRMAIMLLCTSPFLVLFFAWALYSYKIIHVDEAGFHVRDLWGTKTELLWERVAKLSGPGGRGGFVVSDVSGDTNVPLVDASGGEELLALVRRVRPDLWERFDRAELTNGDHPAREWSSSGGLAVLGIIWTFTSILNENFALAALFVALTAAQGWSSLREIVAVRLEPDGVRVRRRWGRRFVPRADVADFVPKPRGGVQLLKHDGDKVDLGRMEGGTEYMLEVLRAWLAA